MTTQKNRDNRVLIVEDMNSLAISYASFLQSGGYVCDMAGSGAEAATYLGMADRCYCAIVLDLQLPDIDGLRFMAEYAALLGDTPVIIATATGSTNVAIAAMRSGASDFLVKPVTKDALLKSVASAQGEQPKVTAKRPARSGNSFHGFVGSCIAMQAVYRAIEQVADSNASIFLSGESGTGKEVGAEAIQAQSKRAKAPFIAINCAAIPENLLESELFGHLKGSFTGATTDRLGAVREANGGTLFLDEICEMDLKLQVKLLRFLQTQTIQPVGSAKTIAVDVRIVCATNRDVVREVAEGRFREDLYYRLSVIPIDLPPLRERERDVLELAEVFLARYGAEEGKSFNGLSDAAKAALLAYAWPGNVRELQNRIRRAAILNPGGVVGPDMLGLEPARTDALRAVSPQHDAGADMMAMLDRMSLDEVERLVIMRAIDRNASNVTTAATELGVSPSTLYRKLERWKMAS